MNKYASGYALVSLISIFGWFVIGASVFGGIYMMLSVPSNMRYIGWIIIIAGTVQGLLLSGMGAIGTAILDGSIAQQSVLKKINVERAASVNNKSDVIDQVRVHDYNPLPDNKKEPPVQDYRGMKMHYMQISGKYLVEGKAFGDKMAAMQYVDEILKNS